MRKSFICSSDLHRRSHRFIEDEYISRLIVSDEPVFVHFVDGFFRCSLEFLNGSLLLSDRSFSRLRSEVYRLYALRLHTLTSNFSLSFYIDDKVY